MPREDADVVRAVFEAWNDRGIDAVAELISPDVEWLEEAYRDPDQAVAAAGLAER